LYAETNQEEEGPVPDSREEEAAEGLYVTAYINDKSLCVCFSGILDLYHTMVLSEFQKTMKTMVRLRPWFFSNIRVAYTATHADSYTLVKTTMVQPRRYQLHHGCMV